LKLNEDGSSSHFAISLCAIIRHFSRRLGAIQSQIPLAHKARCGSRRGLPLAIDAIQLEELDGRRLFELDPELAGDFAQGVVEVREVIDGHVANEGAANFVVSRAAVQPAQEEKELKA
jgi:hypothetical protein